MRMTSRPRDLPRFDSVARILSLPLEAMVGSVILCVYRYVNNAYDK